MHSGPGSVLRVLSQQNQDIGGPANQKPDLALEQGQSNQRDHLLYHEI
jgi:hypothetical protein